MVLYDLEGHPSLSRLKVCSPPVWVALLSYCADQQSQLKWHSARYEQQD